MPQLEQELSNVCVDACLKTIAYNANYKGRAVNVLLSFVPFQKGCVDVQSLLLLLKDQIITKFVMSYKEVQKHYQRKDRLEADKQLYEKALRKITKNTAKGKLGELLLYLFLEKFFSAPKILSKISNLSDSEDQVKGADAVHAQYIGSNLILFLGESKLWATYSGACADAVKSIKTTLGDYQTEFDLIETGIDFPNIDDDLEEEILTVLHPYNGSSINIHTPCFIGFNSDICRNVYSEKQYQTKYLAAAQNRINTFFKKAEGHLDFDKLSLILLPFRSVDDFTKQFIKTLGIR